MDTPQAGQPEPGTSPGGYEFSPAEDAVISDTAKWVGIFAWFAIVGGLLMALVGLVTIPAGLVNVVIGAVYLVIGIWFRGAAKSLSLVVTTAGNDVAHLMEALGNLKSAFMAMVILVAVGFALGILVAVLAATATMMAGGGGL